MLINPLLRQQSNNRVSISRSVAAAATVAPNAASYVEDEIGGLAANAPFIDIWDSLAGPGIIRRS